MTLKEFKSQLKRLEQEQLKAMLEKRHPDYDGKLAHWNFLEATYDGGRDWFDSNIFQYHKEGDKEHNARVDRAYRFNHTREVVDLVNKYIFKADIHRKPEAPIEVQRFWKSATLRGRGIDEFMKLVAAKASIFGKPWIVVDTNKRAGGGTVAEDKANGYRVYAYIHRPQDVHDASFTRDGDLNWVIMAEGQRDDADPWSSGSVDVKWRLWTKEFWALFGVRTDPKNKKTTYVLEDCGRHGLGMVPAFAVDHIATEDLYSSSALIDDIGYLDRAVANYLSNLDAIIQDQTFSQLVIPAQAMLPGEDGLDKILEMGTKRIFTYDAQSNIEPKYIAPDAAQARLILEVVQRIIGEIYHSTGMAGERTKQDNAAGIDNSSGVAKAYDFERMNAMLASKAASLQMAEVQLMKLVLAYNSMKWKDEYADMVVYPKDFDVRGLYDEFEIAQSLALVDGPKGVRREQMKALADKLFPLLKKNLIEKLRKEIDEDWLEIDPAMLEAAAPPSPAGKPAAKKPAATKRQGQVTKDTK